MEKLRRVEIKRGYCWEDTTFDKIKMNDIFRLFDEHCEHIVETGKPTLALSDPYEAHGILTITCSELEDMPKIEKTI